MPICSLQFLLAACGLVAVFHVLPRSGPRRCLLGLVNVLFLVPLVPNWESAATFVALLIATFAALLLVRARPRPAVVATVIGLAFVFFVYIKKYPFVQHVLPVEFFWQTWWLVWQYPLSLVGVSYILFKFIHMLIDEWEGQLVPFTFVSYVNYQLAFFTLLAGPIQRYNDFDRGWREMDLAPAEPSESMRHWNRLLAGLLKMALLANLARWSFAEAGRGHWAQGDPLVNFLVYLYAYPIYLYFNFSGYTDAVIGCAGLLGFRLPENFNRPYLARNVLDFWNRWHMSLTSWIREYVFMAPYKQAALRFPRAARYASYGFLFLALFAAGVWHGTTSAFVVFGALNGLGAVVVQAYGDLLRRGLGRAGFRRYENNAAIRMAATAATFQYVCFCHLFFSTDLNRALMKLKLAAGDLAALPQRVMATRGAPASVAPLALVVALLGLWWMKDYLRAIAARVRERRAGEAGAGYRMTAAKIVLLVGFFFYLWSFDQPTPQVLYMRF